MTEDRGLSLADGMALSEMTYSELWVRYFSLGGTAGELELEAYVLELLEADPYQHDLIAQAMNEHFLDNGGDHPVGYRSPMSEEPGQQ